MSTAYLDEREIGGQFTLRPRRSRARIWPSVEKAVDEELARFLTGGPTAEELERVKTQYLAGFVRGVERIGGFGGKSDILARNQTFLGEA